MRLRLPPAVTHRTPLLPHTLDLLLRYITVLRLTHCRIRDLPRYLRYTHCPHLRLLCLHHSRYTFIYRTHITVDSHLFPYIVVTHSFRYPTHFVTGLGPHRICTLPLHLPRIFPPTHVLIYHTFYHSGTIHTYHTHYAVYGWTYTLRDVPLPRFARCWWVHTYTVTVVDCYRYAFTVACPSAGTFSVVVGYLPLRSPLFVTFAVHRVHCGTDPTFHLPTRCPLPVVTRLHLRLPATLCLQFSLFGLHTDYYTWLPL